MSKLLNIYITLEEASTYSSIPLSSLINSCKEGFIPYIDGKFTDSKETNKELAKTIKILLNELKEEDIISYLIDKIHKNNLLQNIDFLAIRRKFGHEYCEKLIKNFAIIREIEHYKNNSSFIEPSVIEQELLKEYGLTESMYIQEYQKFLPFLYTESISKTIKQINKTKQFPSMCPASKLYVLQKYLLPERQDIEIIYENLKAEAKQKGIDYCRKCIHNINSKEYDSVLKDILQNHPTQKIDICFNKKDRGVLVPSYPTVTRFIKESISDSLSYYSTHDKSLWKARYGNKILREDPVKVNTVFFGDHSQIDILLIYDYDENNNPILRKPWVTMLMDVASGFPVGYVLTFTPDEYTIGACYALACVLKPNYISSGIPLYCYFDRGADYKSNFVSSNDTELIDWNKEPHFLNRDIFNAGIISALGTKVRFANAKSPWVKTIERFFKDLNKATKRYPGYVGGRKKKEIKEKEINRLIKSKRLLTIEEFSYYFKEEILPFLVNRKYRGKKSKYEKYLSLEKENTAIPDWNSLSTFLKFKNTYEVKATGILIRKKELVRDFDGNINKQEVERYYNSKCLDDYKGSRIIAYTLDELYNDSIFCLYEEKTNNKDKKTIYIGEAFLVKEVGLIEDNKFKLQKNLMHQKLQERTLKNKLQAIRYFSDFHNFQAKRYITEEFVDRVDTISEIPSLVNEAATIVSKEAALAKIDECKRIIALLTKLIEEQYPY